jgi:hypothetical protein
MSFSPWRWPVSGPRDNVMRRPCARSLVVVLFPVSLCAVAPAPPIRGKCGQPLHRPRRIYADRGYDHNVYRDRVRLFRIRSHIAHRGTEHWLWLGHTPLGRRGRDRAAALVPPPAHPLGTPRRHPPSLDHPRLRHHLLATTHDLVLIRVLSRARITSARGPRRSHTQHPTLFHVAGDGAWPNIQEHGLLSTAAVVDLYGP